MLGEQVVERRELERRRQLANEVDRRTETGRELDDAALEWVTWEGAKTFTKDMFVAQVRGQSMEPAIPDGAYCLFCRVSAPSSSPDRAVLVRHGGTTDPETGGQYTVKRYRKEITPGGEPRIVLVPANPAFKPIVVAPAEADEVQVIAEVVQTIDD